MIGVKLVNIRYVYLVLMIYVYLVKIKSWCITSQDDRCLNSLDICIVRQYVDA